MKPSPRESGLAGRGPACRQHRTDGLPDRKHRNSDGSEERALVLQAKQGDRWAREQLIERLRSRIVLAGRGQRVDGLELDDLVQEGAVGVLEALVHYEPERGTPFGAYASWWIRHRLQELRAEFARPVRVPPKALRQLARLKSEQHDWYTRERRQLCRDELCERVGVEPEQAEALLRVDPQPCSLYEPLPGSDGSTSAGELVSDVLAERELEALVDTIAGRQLCALVQHLPERERDVLCARFGLDGERAQSLEEVGRRLGLSGERVRQIEKRALARLREAGNGRGGRAR
jgi:RNA polymerase sigma factor (sigma-70 family)